MNADELAGAVVRSLLPVSALMTLEKEPLHGYALIAELRALGFSDLKSGTLYPLLRRLQDDGLLESEWVISEAGPARKQFRITPIGSDTISETKNQLIDRLVKLHFLEREGF